MRKGSGISMATVQDPEPVLERTKVGLARSGQVVRLWEARWLFLQWVHRDFTVRYRQSGLGFAWSLLQPLLLLAFYGIIFVHVLHVDPHRGNYLVFAYCGLAPWTFLATGLSSAVVSLGTAAPVIKQVAFPRVIVPLSAAGVVAVDLAVSVAVLLVLQIATAHVVHVSTLALIPLILGLVLLTSALAIFLGVLGAFVRDARFVIPLLLQVGFIATPVMYDRSGVGGSLGLAFRLNPMAHVIEGFREAVIDGTWPSLTLCASLIFGGLALLLVAVAYCSSVEDRLPDLL
jgi:lipopolysaccharide transport system permease protein